LKKYRDASRSDVLPIDYWVFTATRNEETSMRFMIIVKASHDSEAGVMPAEKLIAEMAKYHEELQKAGALVDASGLQPSSKGFRIRYSGATRSVIDGPFAETKELIAGYTIINVQSRQEAVEWARHYPNPHGEGAETEIEVRQFFELDDFPASAAVERFRELEKGFTSQKQ
jgi:hypothetical protein